MEGKRRQRWKSLSSCAPWNCCGLCRKLVRFSCGRGCWTQVLWFASSSPEDFIINMTVVPWALHDFIRIACVKSLSVTCSCHAGKVFLFSELGFASCSLKVVECPLIYVSVTNKPAQLLRRPPDFKSDRQLWIQIRSSVSCLFEEISICLIHIFVSTERGHEKFISTLLIVMSGNPTTGFQLKRLLSDTRVRTYFGFCPLLILYC